MNKLFFAIAFGASIASTQAAAQDRRGGWMQDQTREQVQQHAVQSFQRFDANHDGMVTRDEAVQLAAQLQAGDRAKRILDRVFGSAQSLTLQQFEAQSLARFDAVDLNHDGTVTAAERQQSRTARQAQPKAQ